MSSSTTLTVRLPAKVKNRLGRLAKRTSRTSSYLAGEAIAAYVNHELEIVEGIESGLQDIEAGRVVSHDQAMRRLRATVSRAAKRRA